MHLHGFLGIFTLLAIAFAMSKSRARISWRIVIGGMLLQLVIAWAFLTFPPVVMVIDGISIGINKVIGFAGEGGKFIFGSLMDASQPWGFVFAVQVLPVIVFFASLMSVLYHVGIMQRVVIALAWVLRRSMGITGPEAMCCAANVFLGQTEAPLCVRPYVPTMTRSQIACLMTGGFATIAGSVMAAYVEILGGDPAQRVLFAKHLLTASVMSAPAAIVYSKMLLPELESPPDEAKVVPVDQHETRNVLDAAAVGATDGLKLALNVAAMLLAFVALLAMVNWPLGALSEVQPYSDWLGALGLPRLSLQYLLGSLFRPIAWTIGIPWEECGSFGGLLGQQVVLTEFVAYVSLSKMSAGPTPELSMRSAQIATYALCGFANFPSIAIQIGGLSAIAPHRRADFATLGLRAMIGGALACWTTAAVASVFI